MTRFYSIALLLSISLATVGQTSNFSRADNNEFEAEHELRKGHTDGPEETAMAACTR